MFKGTLVLSGLIAIVAALSAQTALGDTISASELASLLSQHANDRAFSPPSEESSGIQLKNIKAVGDSISLTVVKLMHPGDKCFDGISMTLIRNNSWASQAAVTYTVNGPFEQKIDSPYIFIMSPSTAGKTSFMDLSITPQNEKPYLASFSVSDTDGNQVDCYSGGK